MDQLPAQQRMYVCDRHADISQAGPGRCPKCHEELELEPVKRSMFVHVASSPYYIGAMAALLLVVTAVALMLVQ
jgi:hypothetical protein